MIAAEELSGRRATMAARLYALEAENSGLREALRSLRADISRDLEKDIEAVRTAQREADAQMLDALFASAQMGRTIKAADLAAVATDIRRERTARRRAA